MRWATDRGFRAILSIYRPGRREARHLWLEELETDASEGIIDEDNDLKRMSFDLDVYEEDDTAASWERFAQAMPRMLAFFSMAVAEGRELLVHCETGVSTSATILVIYMLVKRRVRLDASIKTLKALRREVKISKSLHLGLERLQEEIDRRKLDRLDQRLRNSAVLSIGF